jgi:hypothetical protein
MCRTATNDELHVAFLASDGCMFSPMQAGDFVYTCNNGNLENPTPPTCSPTCAAISCEKYLTDSKFPWQNKRGRADDDICTSEEDCQTKCCAPRVFWETDWKRYFSITVPFAFILFAGCNLFWHLAMSATNSTFDVAERNRFPMTVCVLCGKVELDRWHGSSARGSTIGCIHSPHISPAQHALSPPMSMNRAKA